MGSVGTGLATFERTFVIIPVASDTMFSTEGEEVHKEGPPVSGWRLLRGGGGMG